ncbi:MAG: response regulator [Myxococcales bacterium]|nr:response regulator [Myxococcales bacterium]
MNRLILIADDEAHIRLLLEQALEELEDEGVAIATAGDGARALEVIARERPGLVFLDVMMPGMNGFEVCQAVRADAALAPTKIVMLTAKGQEFDRRRGEEAGADLYLTKPFDPDEIVALARRILEV